MSYNFDIITKIKSVESKLKPSEKKVAQLVLDDLQWAGNASIYELAEAAGVSQASITRFAKVVGCNNVRELKAQLVSSYAISKRFIAHKNEELNTSSFGYIIQEIQDTLTKVSAQISERSLKKSSKLINDSNHLVVFGSGGGSSMASIDAQNRFFRIGVNVSTHQDAVLQRMAASTLDEKSVVLAISTSGELAELNENVRIAKQYGATVISISRSNTALSEISDVHLQVYVVETDDIYKPTASRYALLAVLDTLAYEVAKLRKDQSDDLLRKIKYNFDSKVGVDQRYPLGD